MLPLAARITTSTSASEQAQRFVHSLFDSRIDSVDCTVWGAILLGITCGMLGAFIVLRRQSLMGDAIGHSVLPGVCLGFLAAGQRDMTYMLVGALAAGLLAAWLISAIGRTTVLKSGEAMGLVFTGFYGLGIVLYKWILNDARSGQAGLEKFLFGQIAGISLADVGAMAIVAGLSLLAVIVFWRPLAASSFDESFAVSIGLPVAAVSNLLTILLTTAIVISIQAVGVVLVSAMLITPAAAAYLLTDRLPRMVLLSALFGVVAGVMGAFLSLLGSDAPTGAFMVLSASSVFAVALVFSPRHGLLPRLWRIRERRHRTAAQNLLRTIFLILEDEGAAAVAAVPTRAIRVEELAARRGESPAQIRWMIARAKRRGWISAPTPDAVQLTSAGQDEARRLVRNHRLWELFLTQEAHLSVEQVHADAEYIEHVLPRDVLARLEEMLDRPTSDPHGKPIPS